MEDAKLHHAPTSKQALAAATVVVDYCKAQSGCQNCIFRQFGCSGWQCNIEAFDLREVLGNIEAKKKRGGYI